MPPVIAAVAAYAASAIAASFITGSIIVAGFTISYASIIGAVVGAAVSALMSPKAKAVKGAAGSNDANYPYLNSGTKTSVRNTIAFQEMVYGQVRKSGTIIFESVSSAGVDNQGNDRSGVSVYLNQMIAFAAHECTEFVGLYLDDNKIEVDSDGWVTSAAYAVNSDTFSNKTSTSFSAVGSADTATGSGNSASIIINTAYGTASSQIGAGELIQVKGLSDSAYNGQFQIDSIASVSAGAATQINYTTDQTITSSGISQSALTVEVNNIGYRGTTAYVYDNTGHGLVTSDKVLITLGAPEVYNVEKAIVLSTPSAWTFTYQMPEAPTEVSLEGAFQRRNGTDKYLVQLKTFLGGAGQNIGADADLNEWLPGQFRDTDKGTGLCCVFIRFYDSNKFGSQPQLTAEIKGAKCYDLRDGSLAWTNNAALVIFDYLTRLTGEAGNQKAFSLGLNYDPILNTSTDLDITNFCDAADTCDELIPLLDGTMDRRYTIDGTVSVGENPIDILSLMVASTVGYFTYFDWKAKLFPAKYIPPTANIGESWFTDSLQLTVTNDQQTLTNTVHAIFNDEDNKYYSQDIPPYVDVTALAEDNNQELSEDLQLPYIKNIQKAQRLAKVYLKQKRADRNQLTVRMNPCGGTLSPGDTVTLNYPRLSIFNKTYKVASLSEGLLGEGVSAILRPEDPTYYDWQASEAST